MLMPLQPSSDDVVPLIQGILTRDVLRLFPEAMPDILTARNAEELKAALDQLWAYYERDLPHFHPALLDPPTGQFVYDYRHDLAMVLVRLRFFVLA